MKKILFLLLILSGHAYAQYPILQTLGSDSTMLKSKGGFWTPNGFVNGIYPDTATANRSHISQYPGAQIQVNDQILIRNSTATQWLFVAMTNIKDTVKLADDLVTRGFDTNGHQIIGRLHSDGLVSGGIVTGAGGLSIDITSANYYLNGGTNYLTPQTNLTDSAADPSNPRIDIVVVDTSGQVRIIQGTAAVNPIKPQANPASELELTYFQVDAGATSLNIVSDPIYLEGTEWDTAHSGTIAVDWQNTLNPHTGTYSIKVSSYTDSSQLIFTKPSGTDTIVNSSVLKMWPYFIGHFGGNILGQFYNGSTAVSNLIDLTTYLNRNDSSAYQNGSFPAYLWTFSSPIVNKVVFTLRGFDTTGTKGLFLDDIELQHGIQNPSIDFSDKADSATTHKIDDSTYVTWYWIKGASHQGGDTIHVNAGGGSIPSLNQVVHVGNSTDTDIVIHTVTIGRGITSRGSDSFNILIGRQALKSNTTGYWNTAIGDSALKSNTTGINNTAIGFKALGSITTGTNNTAIGYNAGSDSLSLLSNVFVGSSAGQFAKSAIQNTIIGYMSGQNLNSTANNTAIGVRSLQKTTTGSNNVAIGNIALQNNTTGGSNTAVGTGSLLFNTTGFYNTAIGQGTLDSNTVGIRNVAIGTLSSLRTTTGNYNISIGDSALKNNITGNNNIAIGASSDVNTTSNTNSIAIGTNAKAASYQLAFSDSLTSIYFPQTATAAGTTGAQTINKAVGSVNFAAGTSTLVVTNSMATTTSQIIVTVYGTDATAVSARVTRAAGSFTITLNAVATAETAVGFCIID